jgi:S1-C subfamily serine protease
VLRDLYELSRSFQGVVEKKPPSHIRTVPLGLHSLHEFYEDHGEHPIGRFRIHQVMCWQTTVLIKVGTVFADPESNELRESFVEMLITMVDQSSDTCVASDAMRLGMQRVILCGKGQVGRHARKIWKGGYQRVLDSIQATLQSYPNVDSQVVCPECLAHSHPHNASTWSLDSVKAAAEAGSMVVRCMRGHRVDTNLICGTCKESLKAPPPDDSGPTVRHEKPVTAILPSVVLVGLWDPKSKRIKRVGSGFVVDRKTGLVVTAAHVLFSWEEGPHFGTPYEGVQDAKVVIGVLVDDSRRAVFRYFGEIVSEDVHHVDACVVRITTRMEQDVDDEGPGCADQPETVLDAVEIQKSELRALKMAKRFDLEESVRILGFNQGGEGVFEQGAHVNRHVDVAKGYICAEFKVGATSDDSSTNSSSRSSVTEPQSPVPPAYFVPREEIVIMCPTIPGHSGGPCVNEEGRVVGILSRADPVSRLRCYLVPFSELRPLVKKARKRCQNGQPFYS